MEINVCFLSKLISQTSDTQCFLALYQLLTCWFAPKLSLEGTCFPQNSIVHPDPYTTSSLSPSYSILPHPMPFRFTVAMLESSKAYPGCRLKWPLERKNGGTCRTSDEHQRSTHTGEAVHLPLQWCSGIGRITISSNANLLPNWELEIWKTGPILHHLHCKRHAKDCRRYKI